MEHEWMLRGFNPKKLASASIVPPPIKGFIRAYYFTTFEFGMSDICQRRLKVARLSEVNDPFELLALNFREKPIRKMARDFKKDQDSKTGLLCFSGNWKNPVLWSHYADKHKGVCLGFDLREDTCEKVKYKDKRLGSELSKNDADPSSLPDDLKKDLLCTKSHHWKYEEEVRILISVDKADRDGENLFWPFDENIRLIEVVIGERCGKSVSAVECRINALTSDLYVSRARLAFRSFDVVADGKHLATNLEQRIRDYLAGLKN